MGFFMSSHTVGSLVGTTTLCPGPSPAPETGPYPTGGPAPMKYELRIAFSNTHKLCHANVTARPLRSAQPRKLMDWTVLDDSPTSRRLRRTVQKHKTYIYIRHTSIMPAEVQEALHRSRELVADLSQLGNGARATC